MENLLDLDHDLPFDEHGDYLHTHELAATFTNIEQPYLLTEESLINNAKTLSLSSNAHQLTDSPADYEQL